MPSPYDEAMQAILSGVQGLGGLARPSTSIKDYPTTVTVDRPTRESAAQQVGEVQQPAKPAQENEDPYPPLSYDSILPADVTNPDQMNKLLALIGYPTWKPRPTSLVEMLSEYVNRNNQRQIR